LGYQSHSKFGNQNKDTDFNFAAFFMGKHQKGIVFFSGIIGRSYSAYSLVSKLSQEWGFDLLVWMMADL
jgi:hypothetical protein